MTNQGLTHRCVESAHRACKRITFPFSLGLLRRLFVGRPRVCAFGKRFVLSPRSATKSTTRKVGKVILLQALVVAISLSSYASHAAKNEAKLAEGARSPAAAPIEVKDLRYVAKKGMVVIETSEPASYNTREVPEQNQIVIEIANAKLPARLKRPYITKEFKQSIASINAYQDSGSSTARIVIQFSGPAEAHVTQAGNSLQIVPSEMMASTDDEWTPADAAANDNVPAGARTGSDGDPRILPTSSFDRTVAGDVAFYGKPISLEVRNTSIRDVINLIAEQSGANLVISNEVDGNITLKLRQIPWDQALLIVMKAQSLGYVREGGVLRIAPLQSLQRETDESRKVLDAQKAAEPLKVKIVPVSYADAAQLQTQVGNFLSSRGKVSADSRTNSLVVTDIPENLERVGNLVKALDTPPLQVLIEGKVIEARETFKRDFGIKWKASGQDFDLGGKNMRTNLAISPGQVPSAGSLGIRLGTLDILGDLDASLGLFENDDLIKVVSSPRIMTLNNQAANIVQGTNVAITSSTQGSGGTTTSTSYTPVELKLDVTPQITSESDVIMKVDIKREFVGNRIAGSAPDINRRTATTKVLVKNGQTAVIGGVYQSDSGETEQGVPYLRNIPVLGWLFKSRSTSSEKTELLLFLTPRIINAESAIPKESTL